MSHSNFNSQIQSEPEKISNPSSPDSDLVFANTPNLLTLIRILIVPVVIGLLLAKSPGTDVAAGLLFAAASITDYLDGYLARMNHLETVYGKLMDPLADKFLVVSALIMLQDLGRIHPVVIIILICRELAITGLRALASAEGIIISASESAKWKTATQMVAIPCIIAQSAFLGIPLYTLGMVLLYLSLMMSLWSAKDYVINFFHSLKENRSSLRTKAAQSEAHRPSKP